MAVHSMYRTIINSGLAFGAKHWMATLQLQCERLVFFMATNVPTKDSNGELNYEDLSSICPASCIICGSPMRYHEIC